MKSRHPRPAISLGIIHFRGIAPAVTAHKATSAPKAIANSRAAKPLKRVKFAGIGGGGYRQPPVASRSNTEGAAARVTRQRDIDASWDRAAEAAAIPQEDPAAARVTRQRDIDALWDRAAEAAGMKQRT